MLSGTFAPTAGSMQFDGTEISGLAPHRIINRGIGRTFQIPRPFHRLTMFENVALAGYFGQGRTAAPRPRKPPSARSPWSASPPTATRWSTASAPPA